MTTALKHYVGHPPDAPPTAGRRHPDDPPVFAAGSGTSLITDGWDVVYRLPDPSDRGVEVLLGWSSSLEGAWREVDRLGASAPIELPRHVVIRTKPRGYRAHYEAIDSVTGRRLAGSDSPKLALGVADEANRRGQPPTTAEDEAPDEAHAAIDAMLAEAGRFEGTDASLATPAPGPSGRTLADLLEIEADLLIETGTLGPNARLVLAGLLRQSAGLAKLSRAATVAELLDEAEALTP